MTLEQKAPIFVGLSLLIRLLVFISLHHVLPAFSAFSFNVLVGSFFVLTCFVFFFVMAINFRGEYSYDVIYGCFNSCLTRYSSKPKVAIFSLLATTY